MNGYMKMLREHVGQQPLLQVGASVIIYDREANAVLLQRRIDNDCWSYHGGSVELGERVEETAKRELFEETGLTAHDLKLCEVFSGQEAYYAYPNGDAVYNIDIVYECTEFSGELSPQIDEISELRWFALDDLPEELSPPIVEPLLSFVQNRLFELHMLAVLDRIIGSHEKNCRPRRTLSYRGSHTRH